MKKRIETIVLWSNQIHFLDKLVASVMNKITEDVYMETYR